ncbi:hypothetical protein ACFL17_09235, partial [Pseudomonadota bacterium]
MATPPLKHLIFLLVLFVAVSSNAERDLTYPPPGTPTPIVDLNKGESNRGVIISDEEAEARNRSFREGHILITPEYKAEQLKAYESDLPYSAPGDGANGSYDHRPLGPHPSASLKQQTGLLWKIEGRNIVPNYLFGTMHV